MNTMKKLIAYYSRAGNNIVGGNIVNLPVGNTEVAAKMIQKMTGCDIFRIDAGKHQLEMCHAHSEIHKLVGSFIPAII